MIYHVTYTPLSEGELPPGLDWQPVQRRGAVERELAWDAGGARYERRRLPAPWGHPSSAWSYWRVDRDA